MDEKTVYYVYAYMREDGITPYYIGKGKGRRAYRKHTVNVPSDKTKIRFIACHLFEHEAFLLEKQLVSRYGRKDIGTGVLRNLTDGGDGTSGYQHTEQHKQYIANLFKGITRPEWVKTKMSESLKGKYKNPKSESHRVSIGNSLRGKPKSEEHRLSLSVANLGKHTEPKSLEHKAKISRALRGRIISDSHKLNHSAALKAGNALRKELGTEIPRKIKLVECPHCGKIGGGGDAVSL